MNVDVFRVGVKAKTRREHHTRQEAGKTTTIIHAKYPVNLVTL